jgi:hypothetical protein
MREHAAVADSFDISTEMATHLRRRPLRGWER